MRKGRRGGGGEEGEGGGGGRGGEEERRRSGGGGRAEVDRDRPTLACSLYLASFCSLCSGVSSALALAWCSLAKPKWLRSSQSQRKSTIFNS